MNSGSGAIIPGPQGSLDRLASGQRLVILAILVNISTIGIRYVSQPLALLVALGGFVLAVVGLLRLADGLGYSSGTKVLLIVLLLIPLVSLITLLILNSRATKILREAGHRVGLFGASR